MGTNLRPISATFNPKPKVRQSWGIGLNVTPVTIIIPAGERRKNAIVSTPPVRLGDKSTVTCSRELRHALNLTFTIKEFTGAASWIYKDIISDTKTVTEKSV